MAVSLPAHGDPNPVRQNAATRQLSEELDKLTTDLTAAIAAEETAREDADTTLQTNIDAVASDLADEVTNRTDADATLQTNIDTVASDLADEVTARGDADALLAPIASPVFTGVPEAPTAAEGTDTTQLATTAFVQAAAKWKLVTKTSDQAITSSTTLVDDDELFFSVAANTTYAIKLVLFVVAGAAVAGAKIGINGPGSPTSINATRLVNTQISSVWYLMQQYASVTDYSVPLFNVDNPQVIAPMRFDILLKNGANAGTFAVQIAQSSSSGTATTFQAGSYLEYAVI